MNPTLLDKNVVHAGRYGSAIQADSSNTLPARIEVMRAGYWPETSNKGELNILLSDLHEMKSNFDHGIGVPGGKEFGMLPVDFSHNDYAEAALWITGLEVDDTEGILWANVTYTDAGEAALKGGRFKCFSPSFWPACLGEWHDPEDYTITARNVLVGGGLTNIPFFKDLTAIMASNAGNSNDKQNNNKARKEIITVPTLDEVRIKDVASLTADDKKVLADNLSSLSAEEKTKFSLTDGDGGTTTPVTPAVPVAAAVSTEDSKVLADIRSGAVKLVQASEYDGLKASVETLQASVKASQEKEVTEFVTAQAGLGKIKADQIKDWTGIISADAKMRTVLENLPVHEALKAAQGSGVEEGAKLATDEVREKALELVKAAKDNDQVLPMYEAQSQVLASDTDLANRFDNEVKGTN